MWKNEVSFDYKDEKDQLQHLQQLQQLQRQRGCRSGGFVCVSHWFSAECSKSKCIFELSAYTWGCFKSKNNAVCFRVSVYPPCKCTCDFFLRNIVFSSACTWRMSARLCASVFLCVWANGGGNLTTCDSWWADANGEGWSREGNDCCQGNAELEWLMVG